MLQQIIKDMFIDPELLEELSDDQKQILFFKMREEQIRRWKARQESEILEEKMNPKDKTGKKSLKFFVDDDDNILTTVITDDDQDNVIAALNKKKDEEALKRAEEQARKEAEEERRKEAEELEAKHKAEQQRLKLEEERLAKEKAEREAELKRKQEEMALYQSIKEAKIQEEKAAAEKLELQRKEAEEEAKRKKALEELKKKEEEEHKKREAELRMLEEKRKNELFEREKQRQEEERKKEEAESKQLEEEWKEREKKAKIHDEERRNSFNLNKTEFHRQKKLAKERADLSKFKKEQAIEEKHEKEKLRTIASVSLGSTGKPSPQSSPSSSPFPSLTRRRHSKKITTEKSAAPQKPPLPLRPTISTPVNIVTSTRDQFDGVRIKKDLIKPMNRPPPAPANATKSSDKPDRPNRPKNRGEVINWWKEVEFDKQSGLDECFKPKAWLHGVITRQQAEKLLEHKKKGTYIVRVSERVWGYTVSFKDIGRCKHFLIDTSPGTYQFFGTEQLTHRSLNELIEFHKSQPISGLGQEILLHPCGQESDPPDYAELFVDSTVI